MLVLNKYFINFKNLLFIILISKLLATMLIIYNTLNIL